MLGVGVPPYPSQALPAVPTRSTHTPPPPPNQPRLYTHSVSGETQSEHPLLDYYRGAMFMDKGGYKLLLKNLEARKPGLEEVWGGGHACV